MTGILNQVTLCIECLMGGCGPDSFGLWQGQVAGCCEHGNDSDKWQAVVNMVMIVTSGRLLWTR
jgi:hypothetical protein